MREKVGDWSLFSKVTPRSLCKYVSFDKKSSMMIVIFSYKHVLKVDRVPFRFSWFKWFLFFE
jgi:hypothetical protein